MDNEDTKRALKISTLTQLDQVKSDFALAMALQEQERAFTLLPTIESDSDDNESEVSSEEDDEDDPFFSLEQGNELEFLEDDQHGKTLEMEEDEIEPDELSDSDDNESEVSSEEDDEDDPFFSLEQGNELEFLEDDQHGETLEMEEDEIDPDELSDEELMALGEIVGEENRGLSGDQISACLCPFMCRSVKCKTGIDRCVICQVEYEEGEKLVALSCQHPYHLDCITKWLQIKKICPICSTEVSPPKIASSV